MTPSQDANARRDDAAALPSPPASGGIGERLKRALPPLIGLLLFWAALGVLRRELHPTSFDEIETAVFSASWPALLLALVLTTLNYLVLTGYDLVAFAHVGQRLPRRRIVLASFLAYAVANTVGFATLSGTSVRYRFYTRWGVKGADLAAIIVNYSTTFWLGLLVLGGATLVAFPPPGIAGVMGFGSSAALGWTLLALALLYACLPLLGSRSLRLRSFELAVPRPGIVGLQFVFSILDWALAAAVLYVLLPAGTGFLPVLGAFLAAQLAGLASHVPGGVGVFETAMVVLLKPILPAANLLPALVLYRLIYYLVPLAVALAILVADELRQRREATRRFTAAIGALNESVTPRVLSVFTFLAGAVLLFSGATPAVPERLAWLSRFVPLPLLELSHFMGSVLGVGLLLLSRGVGRRLDAAFYLTAAGLTGGVLASLLKGGDYEEALVVALILLAVVRSRAYFDRRAAFFEGRLSLSWLAAVVAAASASVWLGFFAFKHVDYANTLWWQFELSADTSRFLRASVGAAIILFVFGLRGLLRPARPLVPPPTEAELADAGRIIAGQGSTYPYLVFLRDKGLLFDDRRQAFLMYGVQGQTWAAMGSPIGPPSAAPSLVREFLDRCDEHEGKAVFYEIARDQLHLFVDFGFAFLKLGEEARVPIDTFVLEGPENKDLRQAYRKLEKEKATFRVIPAAEVGLRMAELRAVSDEWLGAKRVAEKGFSLGFFDEEYLTHFPLALIEREGRIEAFANLWPGPSRVDLSVDLMRSRASAPKMVMEMLFVHLMQWGHEQGYRFFELGMAPLSGLESSPIAPLWARVGRFLFRHGEAFYNFQGLRAYKEKFHPVWVPRYLAYPAGQAVPRLMADVAALIAGGYRRMVFK